jgi:hypothetical protein
MPFTAFIDDSGSGIGFFDLNGNPQPVSQMQPVIVAFALLMSNDCLHRFKAQWNTLRSTIQEEMGTHDLPSIHMRLMFGEEDKLPSKHKGLPNPYRLIDRTKRLVFIENAIEIIHQYSQAGKIFAANYHYKKQVYIDDVLPYYQSNLFQIEYGFLRRQSLKATKKLHGLICNPHILLLSQLLFVIDKDARNHNLGKVSIVYDRNPLSKGFDVRRTLQLMRSGGRLSRISSVTESNDIDTPWLQAADVCCNLEFKRLVKDLSEITGDPIVDQWRQSYPIFGLPNPIISNDMLLQIRTVHYAVARHEVETAFPGFAETHLVSVEGFRQRAARCTTGVSILK